MAHHSFENLQTCIEKCTVVDSTFYYDSRFGTKIDDHILHPAYKKCFASVAKAVQEICGIVRMENNFHICIKCDGVQIQTLVRFYPVDKTFVCRDYDPTKIIPAILTSDSAEYLKNKDHPFYKFGYTADYSWSPENLYRNQDLDVDVRYSQAIDELLTTDRFYRYRSADNTSAIVNQIENIKLDIMNPPAVKTPPKKKGLAFSTELDWYNDGLEIEYEEPSDKPKPPSPPLNLQYYGHSAKNTSLSDAIQQLSMVGAEHAELNTDHDSDCDSCGAFGVDDPDEDLPVITAEEIKEIEELFGAPGKEPPDEILATMESPEPKIDDLPRKPLKKLPRIPIRYNPVTPRIPCLETEEEKKQREEFREMAKQQARERSEELIRLHELQTLLAGMTAYQDVNRSLIPKLEERGDNIDSLGGNSVSNTSLGGNSVSNTSVTTETNPGTQGQDQQTHQELIHLLP